MKIKSIELNKLSNLLHSNNINMRAVLYAAMAEVITAKLIANHELTKDYDKRINIKVKNIVNFINELAIVDMVMLEKAILNTLNYKLSKRRIILDSNGIYGLTKFEDVLGITNYFSNELRNDINNNFDIYKNMLLVTMNASNELIGLANGD